MTDTIVCIWLAYSFPNCWLLNKETEFTVFRISGVVWPRYRTQICHLLIELSVHANLQPNEVLFGKFLKTFLLVNSWCLFGWRKFVWLELIVLKNYLCTLHWYIDLAVGIKWRKISTLNWREWCRISKILSATLIRQMWTWMKVITRLVLFHFPESFRNCLDVIFDHWFSFLMKFYWNK